MKPVSEFHDDDRIAQAGADWRLREEHGLSAAEEAALAAWLAADPRHQAAYDDACWALEETANLAAEDVLMAHRSAALAALASRPRRRFARWPLAAAAALVLSLGVGATMIGLGQVPQFAPNPDTASYRTAVGERSAISLPDGSIATLDTNSRLEVRYTGKERGVRLLQGQALFDVAKNKSRPFQVYAGGQRITAVGTLFNVRLDGPRLRVALVEGVVRVSAAPGSGPAAASRPKELVMAAGDVLEATGGGPLVTRPADAKAAAGWRDGVLVFEDAALSDAVAEINRYAARPIVLADPAAGHYRVSGVFKSNDPNQFAQVMGETFSLRVEYAENGAAILRGRDE